MKVKLEGGPEDLIRRLDECGYCIFEVILTPEQRKIKVLDRPIPERHIHRITIEQLCGKDNDRVCPLKYAAMRASSSDSAAAQVGDLNIFLWDWGKRFKREIGYEDVAGEWAKNQDLGRGKLESYAERFREIWNLGIRNGHHILDARFVYELVVAKPETYETGINALEKLKQEYEERDTMQSFI